MSAVIDIASHRPRHAPEGGLFQPDTDELVAELAHVVGAERGDVQDMPLNRAPVVGTPDGPRPLVTIQPDRRGGANDLVEVGATDGKRRRMVIVVAALAMALVLAMFAGLATAGADGDIEVAGSTTLQSGQTLWQLADEITPAGQDVRPNLQAIMMVNDFESASLPAGTLVLLPTID